MKDYTIELCEALAQASADLAIAYIDAPGPDGVRIKRLTEHWRALLERAEAARIQQIFDSSIARHIRELEEFLSPVEKELREALASLVGAVESAYTLDDPGLDQAVCHALKTLDNAETTAASGKRRQQ